MENGTDFVISSNFWTIAGSFGLNTNLLETNLINLGVVLGLLVYFGKGVLNNLLNNRKLTILNTIQDAEERYKEATDKLNQARTRLQQAKQKADDIRINGLSQMEKEKQDLINAADEDSKRLEDSKNATIRFEKQRAIEQVRQQVSRLALERALETLKSRLNSELHLRMIDYHIGLLRAMESTIE
ncbi:ATP synthase CF0 B subunit (chloroplast) [Marchantia polymorpha subsp. ruderalis]|uniref:ATP synthase subunit b, chloroplastic n=3 Tax=Marchantia polymorpha TaxID=3197 RepID=A0A2Z6DT30_MARPO|nr:ATP synthase CF0 B subunit [Marchantia polymorpha subsp. ruderalis]YP_009646798.1 ATP synthase CF0 B subunit [Marchantia polymorpha]AXJ93198.2 ATP synthase CF0 B subunit [Marchantia polymorpha subsp. ruderalis]AZU95185.1 ATP synthase CF0 B subunit [Marchantia polymorpha]QBE89573.1 ATP synthase CF0 B subunit [Marchantia polymorpha subsp. ruderalis]BBD75060.1 ATP synthase CF0 B subunit [Marchantia polymorpha subsp. ruderalis]BDD77243.1 ATP synthase CF0 B subunit [Marchantia polymorpha subsp.